MGTWPLSPWIKRQGREAENSPPSSKAIHVTVTVLFSVYYTYFLILIYLIVVAIVFALYSLCVVCPLLVV
jgi:hypothetical protein